jgi:acyl-CoA synthetase (AMP-forming)/AMP-acid ligase II
VRWIFYTSGTTADPKGARHTDATLLAAARGMTARLELAPDDRVGLVFPFTHVGGVLWLMNGLLSGCAQIAVSVFDPRASIDVLARHGVTQAGAGTAFHQAYLAAQRERGGERIFPRVRAFPGGGAPKPPQLHAEVKRELGGAGIVSGYGMTECPVLAMGSPRDPDAKLAATEGRACPETVEIRVVEGELRVRAPQLCLGYLDPALDAAAFDADGFFRTGDLGQLDADGYVIVTGRLKDVIIRHGENISARELEDLLHAHPAVREVAVVGLPDRETGERACAVLVAKDPQARPGLAELAEFLLARGLAKPKLPEQLELVAELPRNATGKVLKQALRERLAGTQPDPSARRRGGG